MFYENLDKLCKSRGETVTSLAKKLNLSTSKVTAWKRGSIPKGEILLKIAKYFNVSTDYLLTGKEYNPNANVSGNSNVIQQGSIKNSPVTIKNGTERELTDNEVEILKIYNSLSLQEKAELFLQICKFKKEQ